MNEPVGVFVFGARGAVATSAMVGAEAIARGIAPATGLVTALEPVGGGLDLTSLGALRFGGLDVVSTPLAEQAKRLVEQGVLPRTLVEKSREALEAIDSRIGDGVLFGSADLVRSEASASVRRDEQARMSVREAIERVRDAIARFRRETETDRVVCVHLASVEPRLPEATALSSEEELEAFLDGNDPRTPPSLIYAVAALEERCSYLNFTPALGCRLAPLLERAAGRGVPVAGRDGKTGETLLKTVLAPMFFARHLRVLSWVGYNILGNADGAVLADPAARAGKLETKSGVLGALLPAGEPEAERVTIEYVPSLGDHKTAWDHVHFEGFLGARMRLELTWHGCDSALAAPLVLDCVRLLERAMRAGESGPLPELACFFKDPLGTPVHAFSEQWRMLLDLCARWRGARNERSSAPKSSASSRPAQ